VRKVPGVRVGVMIVDDDPDMLVLMQAVIDAADEGLYVRGAATSGEEALARVVEYEPDVVVLDQAMPGMTGVEVAGHLSKLLPSQPMVLFTAYLTPDLVRDASDAGIARCVSKTNLMQLPDVLRELTNA
jgi:DNA-binding NarL/FixJ family response regulator